MGWFDTKNKHQQVVITANAWDMQRIEERERRRRWFIFLDVVIVICFLVGISFIYSAKNYVTGGLFIGIAVLIILYLMFRKKKKNNLRRNHRRHRHHHRRRR